MPGNADDIDRAVETADKAFEIANGRLLRQSHMIRNCRSIPKERMSWRDRGPRQWRADRRDERPVQYRPSGTITMLGFATRSKGR